jgi:hypothetical protein
MCGCARSTGVGSPQPTRPTVRTSVWAKGAIEAVEHALEPFERIVDELLAGLPRAGVR